MTRLETSDEFCFVYSTFPDQDAAMAVARALVDAKLAACVNVYPPMLSTYVWQGTREEGPEVAAFIARCKQGGTTAAELETQEKLGFAEPAAPALVAVVPDPALDARIAATAADFRTAAHDHVTAAQATDRQTGNSVGCGVADDQIARAGVVDRDGGGIVGNGAGHRAVIRPVRRRVPVAVKAASPGKGRSRHPIILPRGWCTAMVGVIVCP